MCRGLALMLLQNAVKFNLREFQEVWQQSVPEGMSTRLDQLKVSVLNKDEFWYIHMLCPMYVKHSTCHPAHVLTSLQIS